MGEKSTTTKYDHDSALGEELSQCISARGLTQAAVSRALGISDSALSQWLSGRYKGDVKSLEHAVKGFLQRATEKAQTRRINLPFNMTSVSAKIFEAARMCHLDGDIGVVVGDSGIGKTTTLKEYARLNSDVILIEADRGYSPRELFREIHRGLGLDGTGSINQMKNDVISRLEGTGRLIIVDEAEHLPVKALDLIRRINDKAETGILFCGLKRFMDNLRLKQADFAYLYTRVGFKVLLDQLQSRDIEAIVHDALPGANGIWKTFHEESHGNGRVLSKLVKRSQRLADVNNLEITPDLVREAAKMLMV